MATVPKHYLTPEEYLHRERNAEYHSEYFRGEMFAMTGASANHNLIVGNCVQTLGQQLKKNRAAFIRATCSFGLKRPDCTPTPMYRSCAENHAWSPNEVRFSSTRSSWWRCFRSLPKRTTAAGSSSTTAPSPVCNITSSSPRTDTRSIASLAPRRATGFFQVAKVWKAESHSKPSNANYSRLRSMKRLCFSPNSITPRSLPPWAR